MRGPGVSFRRCMVAGLGFGWRDVPDRFWQAAVGEPVHPSERCAFHCPKAAPRSPALDAFGLEQPVDRLGQRAALAVADAARSGLAPGFRQALGAFDRQMPAASVAVLNEPHALCRSAFTHRLFEGTQNEPGMRGGADAPRPGAHDPTAAPDRPASPDDHGRWTR